MTARRDTTADEVTPVARAAVRARGPRAPHADPDTAADEPAVPDATRVDPDVLATLLARHGWIRRGGSGGRYSRWAPPNDQEPDTSLLVPADRGFDDSVDLLEESLSTLARSGVPSARAILAALLVPGDEIHWRREVPGVGGAVPWGSETELREAATAMLAAAAKAGRARCAYYGARLDRYAARFLDRVLVVPPGTGAGLLTAYTPAPTDRPAATTLVLALEALREAVDLQRATGQQEAFDNGVRLGLSHELISSVVLLVRGSEGARISLHWSAQVGPPPGFGSRRPAVEFSPGDLPALEAAAARLERSEPAVDVELTGAVVRLKRAVPGGEGVVRLRVLSGAEVDEVRIRLGDADYRVAVGAHLDGTAVRVRGRLERKGGFRRLGAAHDVTVVDLDDAERERLAKTLRLRAGLASGEDETD
ncbi:hypothetical protein [Streptacidiphilus jiangxiensis]|uniref:Uncharacterized protein n=1 Tax=Streptacidiphilus jiangxiensis TaxID=235985 RepID=A0A1H7ZG38_STRJI|nr:hypothetical protein [Streptacidiphilus jiangxiensis]SEM57532.1 hypothetical protein SAMN05414137_13517 [Streptacidiphilus jiangxiensis]